MTHLSILLSAAHDLIGICAVVFLIIGAVQFSIGKDFVDQIMGCAKGSILRAAICVLLFCLLSVGQEQVTLLRDTMRNGPRLDGAPLSSTQAVFEGKTFLPQAVVVIRDRLLVHDADGKVYAFDNIALEPGLSLTNMAINVPYVVYKKADTLYLGKADSSQPKKG